MLDENFRSYIVITPYGIMLPETESIHKKDTILRALDSPFKSWKQMKELGYSIGKITIEENDDE